MKIKKILIPTLSITGAALTCTPLICLTSCSSEATTKELYTIAESSKKCQITDQKTDMWTFTINTNDSSENPDDLKVNIFVLNDDNNLKFNQCIFNTSAGGNVNVSVGYTASSEGLTKSQDIISKFKLQLTWTESKISYKQDISDFELTYSYTKI